jgi:DNA-binding MarR family transcriptional regulator
MLREFERLNQIMIAGCCKGVTLAQCHVLLEIEELGDTTTLDLSKNLKLDKSTMSRTVDSLVSDGLVNRKSNRGDRRYKILSLTEKGKKSCDEINNQNDAYFGKIFDNIAHNKRQNVITYFSLLVEAIKHYEKDSVLDESCFN